MEFSWVEMTEAHDEGSGHVPISPDLWGDLPLPELGAFSCWEILLLVVGHSVAGASFCTVGELL